MAAPACEEADATQCISSPGAGLPLECAEPDPAAPCEIAKGRVSRRRPLRSHSGNSRVEVTCCGGPARVLDAVAAAETLCLIAADTVYDSVLTEAFVKCAATLLSYHSSVRGAAGTDRNRPSHHHKSPISNSCAAAPADSSNCGAGQETRARLVVSLEMRINFVVKGMTEGSPAVDDFMSYVTRDTSTPDAGIGCRLGVGVGDVDCGLSTDRRSGGSGSNVGGVSLTEGAILHAQHHGRRGTEGAGLKEPSRPTARPQQLQGAGAGAGATAELPAVSMPPLAAPSWAVEGSTRRPLFKGRRLDLTSVPQALQYERCNQLELWELTLL
ncbi:hypothetical protein Vretimale_13974 [Volvox reticuliferus]|nr:hypothetical protein Vretifemale_16155 [Volvox reticuliferus]GIM10233.1 hypothetical protein Vretimale_13974 [Volvox reticuliferus]